MSQFKVLLILFFFLVCNKAINAEEDGFDFLPEVPKVEGLPWLYFGLDTNFGMYRESDYTHALWGLGLVIGMPVDFVLSAECYADAQFHLPNGYTKYFWKSYFGINQDYELLFGGFRIFSAGGRFKFLFLKYITFGIGGGLGFFGFTPAIRTAGGVTVYSRQSAILYEVELSVGYQRDLSKKYFLKSGIDVKFYFIENLVHHQMSVVWDVIGFGYRYF